MNQAYEQEHRWIARRFARMIREMPDGIALVADLLEKQANGEDVTREAWFAAWKQASAR